MDKEKFSTSGLMELYVLVLASPAEQKIVMNYALAYSDIQETLNLSVEALEEYAQRDSLMPPKGLLKKNLDDLKKAEAESPEKPPIQKQQAGEKSIFCSVFLAIGILIFGILALLLFRENQAGAQQYRDLQEEYTTFKTACDAKDDFGRNLND
jgi:hypothetical protein